ncbi:hypothetical protein BDZ97DRAFT_1182954 [Flammula alnicola]|nr:hypothetical protein BDZ97DRAFT_1182954 [Flammula alnicola]
MVRLATSVLALAVLAGSVLSQESYEQYERSLSENDLHARAAADFDDYLVVRQSLEEEYGSDLTDLETREVFEYLEERAHGASSFVLSPELSRNSSPRGPFRREFEDDLETREVMEQVEERSPGARSWLRNKFRGSHAEDQPQERSFYDLEEIMERDLTDTDSDLLERDVMELEERSPGVRSWLRNKFRGPAQHAEEQMQERSFDDQEQLEARSPGLFTWLKSKFTGKPNPAAPAEEQLQERSFDDLEEVMERDYMEGDLDFLERDVVDMLDEREYEFYDELD